MDNKVELTKLATTLLAKTQKGKIRWAPADYPKMYETKISKAFTVTVLWEADYRKLKDYIRLAMWDKKDNLITEVSSYELENATPLEELYQVVQDQLWQQSLQRGPKTQHRVKDVLEALAKV
jgi:hypothetical protein